MGTVITIVIIVVVVIARSGSVLRVPATEGRTSCSSGSDRSTNAHWKSPVIAAAAERDLREREHRRSEARPAAAEC